MDEDTEASGSSPITDGRLRLVYVAGIALNLVALYGAARAGEWLFAVTFGFIIAYICFRYWMTVRDVI
jgi:hypothetical protein